MRSIFLSGLVGFVSIAAAQSSTANTTDSSSPSTSSSLLTTSSSTSGSLGSTVILSTSSSFVPSASSTQATAITVATDDSGQFTAIGAAVTAAQNSGIATVSVMAGTYTEAVMIPGTQTVTIVGPTASSYAQNQVVITTSGSNGAIGFGTSNSIGATFKYLNFTNTATSGTAPAAFVKGSNIAFYGCSLISSSTGVYYSSYSTALIYDSYIEGSDKLFTNYPTVYVYGSTIVPLSSNALIMYGKGATINGVNYNSTLVVDSSSVVQKTGYTNTYVYLAAPNGAYTQAIYRKTTLGSLIAPSGFYSTSCTASLSAFYGEFENSGSGAISSLNSASRSAACDNSLVASQMSAFTIDQVFGNAYPGYGTFSTSWIDTDALSAISNSDASQIVAASSSVASPSTMLASSVSSSGSASSILQSSGNFTAISTSASSIATSLSSINSSASSTISSSTVSTSASSSCAAPTPSGTFTVSLNATTCQYGNISAAIAALPADSKPYTILIMPGTYNEQLSITRNGKVTLIGQTTYVNDYTKNEVKIQFSNGQLTSAGLDETTPVINAKKTNDNSGLALYNIDFINTYPQTANTAALAADFYGADIAAYGCSFIGYQDTLLANKGTQVFSNCYIEGSIDYIWGYSTAYFHQCYIATNTKGACIAAQSRTAGTVSGYVFDTCYVTYTSTYGTTFQASYLGRPYNDFSTAVYMNSYIDKHIAAAGWSVWSTSAPQTSNVTFGEYNNTGPGSWQTGTARASFATNFTSDEASAYTLANWVGDISWIDTTAYNYEPSFSFPASTTTPSTTTSTGSTTTASINAHPGSGTAPPQYAVLVSPNGEVNGSYPNVTSALAALPSDSTNQTIFIYAGTYTEQLPSINRPGAINIIGYTSGNPGQSYQDNEVTITFSRGLSVSPLPTGHSDAETATISTASNRISFYNINIINSDNLDGSEASYVTLAGSIYGNDIGFYACYFQGWQDTLLTGSTTGYQYYESSYIEGAIDFIWGYSKAYFKGCTIGAKNPKSAMTAQSRASLSAIGGYIFDQCLFTAAADATVSLTNTVFLGRPYSEYALVVVKNSYIDSVVSPSGWKVWSTTDPRTDFITFAEYNNSGPSNWENNVAARLAFGNATLLTSDTYPLASVMDSTSWIDMTYWDSIITPEPATVNTTTTTSSSSSNVTVSGSSTYNGTTPPNGALIVSKNAISGVTTYDTIQSALDAAPAASKTNATIFIYPGVYEEQLIVNKSGTTIFMGYSDETDDYSQNQVTIQQSVGVDTQGDGSDVDSATVYVTGNKFYAYNINFRNDNGTQFNIASLGFAVQSSKYAFMHGCQIYGNQDTLYVSGSLFTFKSYIEGNVDFIFGAGLGYFLNTTISPNKDGDSLTAAKRATNTTQAGFVFDQCTLVPAAGNSGFSNVSLGRPWNDLAQVVYVDSYFDSMIGAAGWDVWSKSSPQTDAVTYGEYHNYGPGSSICGRVPFSHELTDSEVVQYELANFFPSTSWIDFSVVDVQPFTAGIGSAPASCATASSSAIIATVLPSSSRTSSSLTSSSLTSSSLTSSSLTSSSITSSSSTPLVTAYVTKTTVDKETLYTTVQAAAATSTVVSVVTEDDDTTVTPAMDLRTSTLKTTSTLYSTYTQAANTVTVKSTQIAFATTTVQGKSATVKSTSTITETTTIAGKTSTVKATTTLHVQSTSTPKDITTTVTEASVQTSYYTSTPKATTVTSTSTISAAGSTKTSSAKANTVTSLTTSIKTTTKKTTSTEKCVPTIAARLFRRGLEARAAGTTTLTQLTTVTTYVKTSTAILAGSTYSVTSTSTISDAAVSTLPASTSTVIVTSVKTVSSVETDTVAAATVTSVAYITSVATVSSAGSTYTDIVYSTALITVSQEALASTSYQTVFSTSVVTVAQPTVTVTRSADSTTVSTTVLAAPTSTVYKTTTVSQAVVTVTITPAAETKISTVKSTSTVYSTVTKTAKNAPACTN